MWISFITLYHLLLLFLILLLMIFIQIIKIDKELTPLLSQNQGASGKNVKPMIEIKTVDSPCHTDASP